MSARSRNPGAVGLRDESPDDEDFLYRLFAAVRSTELSQSGVDSRTLESLLEMQYLAQRRSYDIQFPEADRSIVCSSGVPIGRLIVDRSGSHIVLVDIALLPQQRGKGIGSYLIMELMLEAEERGVCLRLKVALSNPSRALYQRLGFKSVGDDGMYEQMEWEYSGVSD